MNIQKLVDLFYTKIAPRQNSETVKAGIEAVAAAVTIEAAEIAKGLHTGSSYSNETHEVDDATYMGDVSAEIVRNFNKTMELSAVICEGCNTHGTHKISCATVIATTTKICSECRQEDTHSLDCSTLKTV